MFAPARLGPVGLRNRIIKAATFEGRTPGGEVTDDLVAFHREVAAGGVGMTTVAYCAVSPEGRTHADQLVLGDQAVPGLRRLTDAVHAEGAAASAQIGHAGPVANAASNGVPSLAPSRSFNPLSLRFNRPLSPEGMDRLTERFAAAAVVAVESGFDCLELHLGHSYLLSAFLSPKLNRRRDGWGGDVEARARFPRRVVRAVRDAVGSRVAVIAKYNLTDGVRGGLGLADSLATARLLEADGGLDALVLTAGSSLDNPMFLFRGAAPVREFAATLPAHLRLPFRLVGSRFLRSYPYEEAYLLPLAREFRAGLTMPLVLLGGITGRATVDRALAEGFQFVAMARALLAEPDLVHRMRADSGHASACVHCNLCMPTIYTRTRCTEFVSGQQG